MHQCDEDDEDFQDDVSNLYQAWGLSKLQGQSTTTTTSLSKRKTKRIFVPINDQYAQSRSAFAIPGGGSHWSLLLWEITIIRSVSESESAKSEHGRTYTQSMGEAEILSGYFHFDSYKGYNSSAAKAVAKKLSKVLTCTQSSIVNPNVSVVECQTPQQNNGYDCGVFMLGFAEALALDDSGFGSQIEYETALKTRFDAMGGQKRFASGLRKSMAVVIRELASES